MYLSKNVEKRMLRKNSENSDDAKVISEYDSGACPPRRLLLLECQHSVTHRHHQRPDLALLRVSAHQAEERVHGGCVRGGLLRDAWHLTGVVLRRQAAVEHVVAQHDTSFRQEFILHDERVAPSVHGLVQIHEDEIRFSPFAAFSCRKASISDWTTLTLAGRCLRAKFTRHSSRSTVVTCMCCESTAADTPVSVPRSHATLPAFRPAMKSRVCALCTSSAQFASMPSGNGLSVAVACSTFCTASLSSIEFFSR